MFSVFPRVVTVPLFGDIWLHDTGKLQYHIPDIAMRFIFLYYMKQNVLSFLYGESEAYDCSCCLPFSQEQRNSSFLTTSSFLTFFCQMFSLIFYFLLLHCHLNTLYMIQLQFHYNLGNIKFLCWLLEEWFSVKYLHGCHSCFILFFPLDI